ncbi:MAG: signal transduction histidine kinase [Lysobacterales bacterium]
MCAIDNKRRELNLAQLDAMRSLRRQVISQMELRHATRTLKSANKELLQGQEQLLQVSRHKSFFLSNMSHEIRTPLNSMLGFSQILERNASNEKLSENALVAVRNIQSSGAHLLSLIDGILELSRIEANKIDIDYSEVNLRELIEIVFQINLENAKTKDITLRYNIESTLPQTFVTDRTKLIQILMNLIGNAIKFTKQGGSVSVESQHEEGYVAIRVIDNGIGIEEANLELIFRAFEQVDSSSTRPYGGTGMERMSNLNSVYLFICR